MTQRLNRILKLTFPVMLMMLTATSCIRSGLDECPNDYRAAFRYDMNVYGVDAFAEQVPSIILHAFDAESGQPVHSSVEYGEALDTEGYRMPLDLPPGTYDVVVWGGMHSNQHFSLLSTSPSAMTDLAVSLNHDGESSSLLTPLYHGKSRVVFTDNNETGSIDPQTVVIPLVKNTNRVNIHLVRLDGATLSEDDFSVRLTAANASMSHDNSVSGNVVYRPWAITIIDDYSTTDTPQSKAMTITTPRAHRSELSTGRLMAEAHSNLEVFRTADGERIVSIPLEDNLLQYRKEYYATMGEQEYLDRLDDFDISFILTEENGWNPSTRIYINKWAVVPIQYVDW